MTLETFFEKFELFADAPDAVAKLRELIIELAVTGQLIQTSDWKPTELGAVCEKIHYGYTAKANHTIDAVCLLRISDIQNNQVIWSEVPGCEILEKEQPKYLLRSGDILIARTGGTVGKSFLVGNAPRKAVFASYLIRLIPSKSVLPAYLKRYLESPHYWRQLSAGARGAAQPNVNGQTLAQIKLPLPSLAEQKRIVAKVDELMAVCDRLEEQQKEREKHHAELSRAALSRFGESPTPDNLRYLFHPSFHIPPADLRKSILTLAVQGKLVPQDPNDEPAEDLISRICDLRSPKKAKNYAPVTDDEMPFEIPLSWSWTRLGNISLTSDSGWSPQCHPESREGVNWGVLKVSAVSWGIFKPDENKALPPRMEARPECEVRRGDFLLSRANTEELVARSVVIEQTPPRLMMSDKIVRFTFPGEVEKAFVNMVNLSDPSRTYYARNASGTSSSMKNVGREVMCNLPIPLPPLAEQRRIVAKVDELMTLVDSLETQLSTARTTAVNLLSAAVTELTTSP